MCGSNDIVGVQESECVVLIFVEKSDVGQTMGFESAVILSVMTKPMNPQEVHCVSVTW